MAHTRASNLFRRRECPGSAAAEAPFAEQNSEDAAEGQLLHRCFFSDSLERDILTEEQMEALLHAEDLAERFMEEFAASHHVEAEPYKDLRERELVVRVAGYDVTGHCDLLRLWEKQPVACIIDAKFGRLEVEEAPDNIQLAHYACGVRQEFFREAHHHHVGVAIVQPRAFGPHISKAVYNNEALSSAVLEIDKIVLTSQRSKGKDRTAGEWCRYCLAKEHCATFREAITVPNYQGLGISKDGLVDALRILSNPTLEELFDACHLADFIRDAVRREIRTRIEADQLPGFTLRNMGSDRTVTDNLGAMRLLNTWLAEGNMRSATAKEFEACMELSIGKLEKLVKEITGLPQKTVKLMLRNTLRDVTTEIPKAKAPVRSK